MLLITNGYEFTKRGLLEKGNKIKELRIKNEISILGIRQQKGY